MKNYKRMALILCVLFTTVHVLAQHTISGTVKDQTNNETMPGVAIYFPALKMGTTTDINGNFHFTNLKNGNYLMEVTSTGYKTVSKNIDLQHDTTLNISLKRAVTELGAVVVTGVSRATEKRKNPIIISTLSSKQMHENAASNAIDALKEIPGVSQRTTGPNISKPIIRGLGGNRVITLFNGIRQEGQQWGDEHGIAVDQYAIDRVEIIKGPGSLLYGSDGIAGVLNFLPPKPLPEGTIRTQVLANYQSNNQLFGYSVANRGNKNGFYWTGRFSNKYAGNYQNKYDGRVLNSGFKEYDGNLLLGLSKRWGHTTLSVHSYNTKLGIVEGERDSLGRFIYENALGEEIAPTQAELKKQNIYVPYQWVNHLGIASNSYIILNSGTLNADVGYQFSQRREFEEADDPQQVGLSLRLNTLTYNIRYNLKKMKGWETTFGLSGMQQTNINQGDEFLIPDYQLFDIGAFAFTQKTFRKLTLAGGLRFDFRALNSKPLFLSSLGEPTAANTPLSTEKFTAFKRHFSGVSGSVGLTYQTSKISTLKFNFSNGYRAPNIAELASNGKHEGTFRYEIGNPNLKPEFSHQFDVAFFEQSDHVTFQVSPFVNFISNYSFIQKMKDANGNPVYFDSTDLTPAFEYTSGNALLWGGEIYLDIHPHPLDWLHIENMFSVVYATQRNQPDSMRYLPNIPAPHYRGSLKAAFNRPGKTISGFYFKFNVDYYFPQTHIYNAYATETATPGYTLLSAGAGISIRAFEKDDFFNFYLSAENLTDVAYQNHLSRLKYADINPLTGRSGVFNMGRNISLKLLLNF